MGYFIDPDGNYPRHAGDVQLVEPGWTEGTDALPYGWINVEEGTVPTITDQQVLVELQPALVKGVYVRQFRVDPKPAEGN